MGGIRRFGFRAKLIAQTVLAVLSVIVVQVIMNYALHTVKIEGPLYALIARDKDFINDLTTPSLIVRGPFLTLHRLALETDVARNKEWMEQFRGDEKEFIKTFEKWSQILPSGNLKDALRDEVHKPAMEFFQEAHEKFMPAIEGNDAAAKQQAIGILRGSLTNIFRRQQLGTEKVAQMAKDSTMNLEKTSRESVAFWNWVVILVGAGFLAVILVAGWWITRGIVGSTNELIRRMRQMAEGEGDLTARVEVDTNDEMRDLADAINTVIKKIHDLVVRVRESSIQLYASSTEIAATSREQESTMQNLGASTNQIAAAVKEITATSVELSKTMNAVNEGGKQAGSLAAAGRVGLNGMAAAMNRLADGTNSISGRLGVVREKANDINVVVTTITKVADQTNLLSINAAIEAEKAGESGRGFLVVAREIRRLADQTAVATLDIENMVRQMQAAVSSGVMEMDKFADEVRGGVARVAEINSQIGQIIEQVQGLNERFAAVNDSMSQQTAGAGQINDAMLQLAAGVQQTSASLKEFHTVTGSLRDAADALKQLVAKFKVAG